MVGGERGRERVEALGTYLVTVLDHGFNASTFAARPSAQYVGLLP
jgi:citrate synthase